MPQKEENKSTFYESLQRSLFIILAVILLLSACTPFISDQIQQTDTPQEEKVNTTSDSEVAIAGSEATATLNKFQEAIQQDKTRQASYTETPVFTASPEATTTPEVMTQAEIRAEILAAGVNLDDLANSRDEWTSSHISIEKLQNDIDNLNFGRETEGFITTVVIGLEAVENLEELDQALLTDGGWKLTAFAKLAYKDVNGDWQIIKDTTERL